MKSKTIYVCNQCGYESPKWMGKCPECNQWNTLEEEVVVKSPGGKGGFSGGSGTALRSVAMTRFKEIDESQENRYLTGLSELDRVLGGGIVKGSLVLLSGEPGAGKSTLLLQISAHLSEVLNVLYVSGEESMRQIKLRANRLGVASSNMYLAANTHVEEICHTIETEKPDLVVIDSIQTMQLAGVNSMPGSVTQVRESTNAFMKTAKSEEIPIFIVGHVNKDGAIAGPKVLEHIVDTVLYFEGDRNLSYRILRASKNRYGSTNEIGVFDMTQHGLNQVDNPSEMFLTGKPTNVPGTCVTPVLEGSRPILAEIQALVAKTGFAAPRRTSNGFDFNRTNLLIAVLEKRCGYFMGNLDVYINIVGGLKLMEPGADLPVMLSMASSLRDKVIGDKVTAMGEVGLTGEVRAIANVEARLKEAQRLGFESCILPLHSLSKIDKSQYNIELIGVKSVREALSWLGF